MTNPSLPPDQRTITTTDVTGSKLEPIPGMEVCDFCTGTPNVARYPCGLVVFEAPTGTHVSSDPWGACAECHALIEADDRDGLARRSLRAFTAENPHADREAVHAVATMLADVQGRFFAARLGDAQPL